MPNLMRHYEQAFVVGESCAECYVHEDSFAVSRRRAETAVTDWHKLHPHQESACKREAHKQLLPVLTHDSQRQRNLKLVVAVAEELIVLPNVLKFRPLANWDAGSVKVVNLCAANTEQEW